MINKYKKREKIDQTQYMDTYLLSIPTFRSKLVNKTWIPVSTKNLYWPIICQYRLKLLINWDPSVRKSWEPLTYKRIILHSRSFIFKFYVLCIALCIHTWIAGIHTNIHPIILNYLMLNTYTLHVLIVPFVTFNLVVKLSSYSLFLSRHWVDDVVYSEVLLQSSLEMVGI